MEPDRSLFGSGPYPITGPLAIAARAAFLMSLAGIAVAVLLPADMVPQFLRSSYLEHFAAYYVATLLGLAASPRAPLPKVAARISVFATLLEAVHLLRGAAIGPLIDNWVADLGGVAAALAPFAVARFRARFAPPPS
ncbi:MAG: hypothetical protein DI570_08515 [Phenylobacterium zucineum]|nr:MAG: hypothetical protein DI570_08515 [Phenylobacterium zucineum]